MGDEKSIPQDCARSKGYDAGKKVANGLFS
jgi:hypothetical protein